MRAGVNEASTCESWSIAIEEQRKALRSEKEHQRESGAFLEALASPSLLARNHELFSQFVSGRGAYTCVCACVCCASAYRRPLVLLCASAYKSVLLLNSQETAPPRIAMISVVSASERERKPEELVIKRKVSWGDVLDLGVIAPGGACVILLQGGGIGRIGTQALMGSWDAGQACWIDVTDTEHPTEIQGALLLLPSPSIYLILTSAFAHSFQSLCDLQGAFAITNCEETSAGAIRRRLTQVGRMG